MQIERNTRLLDPPLLARDWSLQRTASVISNKRGKEAVIHARHRDLHSRASIPCDVSSPYNDFSNRYDDVSNPSHQYRLTMMLSAYVLHVLVSIACCAFI